MLNITNHQRNANQNQNELSPHTYQNSHHQKHYKLMLAWIWRKGNLSKYYYCWWECKLVQALWKTVWRFLRKLKMEL